MRRSKSFVRSVLIILLVAGCVATAVAPILMPASAAPKAVAISSDVLISEIRFLGSGGEIDEFVELFNRSCTDTIQLSGWTLELSKGASKGTTPPLYAFGNVTMLPGQYYLVASTGYDDAPDAPPMLPASPDLPRYALPGIDSQIGGVALFKPGSTEPVDAVGFTSDGYSEGTPITFQTYTGDLGYTRRIASGKYVDTNDNAEDFGGPIASTPQNSSRTDTCGLPTQTISGNVAGPAGVTLSYTDATGAPQSVTTDATGNYQIIIPSNWSGTVTPSLAGYSFVPSIANYHNVLADKTGQNYTAALNTPTRTPVPSSLTIVINEVAWMGTQESGTDQWIELYNPQTRDISLKDWTLRGAGTIITLTGTISAHCYLVIEKNSGIFRDGLPTDECPVKTEVASGLSLSTYGAILFLNSNTGNLIDTANNNGGPWPAGLNASGTNTSTRATMERHAVVADTDTVWYTFAGTPRVIVYDKGGHPVKGTPGQKNWAYTVNATPSPVPTRYKTPTSPPPTPFAHMVINEFLPRAGHDWNQDGTIDVFDEFIEVKNLGPIDVDVRGWKLSVISSAGSNSFVLPSQRLKTNERAVFYRSTTQLSLPDSGGTVRLINTRGIVIDARSYGPVDNPDQATCRLPDGYYWHLCFPTPGLLNTETGFAPAPPPSTAGHPPACLLADTVPVVFREAECNGFGSDIFNAKYWDDQSGFKDFPVLDVLSKWLAVVR